MGVQISEPAKPVSETRKFIMVDFGFLGGSIFSCYVYEVTPGQDAIRLKNVSVEQANQFVAENGEWFE